MDNFLDLANLEQFYAEHPDSVVFSFIAYSYLEQGNIEKALAMCEEGLKKHPQYPFGHYVLGLCHYHMNDYSNAKKHLEFATAYDDKNPGAWKILGEINKKIDLPEMAEECELKYFLLDPFNPESNRTYPELNEIDQTVPRQEGTDKAEGAVDTRINLADEDLAMELEEDENLDELFNEQLSNTEEIIEEEIPAESDLESGEKIEEEPQVKYASSTEKETPEEEIPPGAEMSKDQFKEDIAELLSELDEDTPAEEQTMAVETEEENPAETKPEEEKAVYGEPALEVGEESPEGGEDLLDISSVVEDIISEQTRETLDSKTEVPLADNDDMNIEEDDEIFTDDENEAPENDMQGGEKKGDEEEMKKAAHLGRPPILSPTIGEIYIAQGRFEEAIEVFKQLMEKDPENKKYQKKIDDITTILEKQKTNSTGN